MLCVLAQALPSDGRRTTPCAVFAPAGGAQAAASFIAGRAMRVAGGQWKGRPLVAPAGRGTRPTSDKVREAIFAVLAALPQVREGGEASSTSWPLAGHVVLDLFAGTGALGIEALSRGAGSCTFVEKDRPALRAVRANLERLGVATGGPATDAGVDQPWHIPPAPRRPLPGWCSAGSGCAAGACSHPRACTGPPTVSVSSALCWPAACSSASPARRAA